MSGAWLEQKSDPHAQEMLDNRQALEAMWETFVDDMYAVAFNEIWHFAGWSVPTYARFYEDCQSAALWHPFAAEQSETFEHWLSASFGLCSLRSQISFLSWMGICPRHARAYANLYYVNILIPPPDYERPYGRTRADGKVVWGNLRWK